MNVSEVENLLYGNEPAPRYARDRCCVTFKFPFFSLMEITKTVSITLIASSYRPQISM